jgi:predicted transcriptional regulator
MIKKLTKKEIYIIKKLIKKKAIAINDNREIFLELKKKGLVRELKYYYELTELGKELKKEFNFFTRIFL